jgi:hypothetical protein
MLVRLRHFLAFVAIATSFLVGEEARAAVGGYSPCMVAPVYVQPVISAPLFTRGEILTSTFSKAESVKWGIMVPDFEVPVLIQPVITQPRYDGCTEQSERRAVETGKTLTTREGKVLLAPGPSAAARIMKGADICCGTGGGK